MTDLTKRIAVDPQTLLKIQKLRSAHYGGFDQIGDLARFLIDDAWQEALNAGLVKESMLAESAVPSKGEAKKGKK